MTLPQTVESVLFVPQRQFRKRVLTLKCARITGKSVACARRSLALFDDSIDCTRLFLSQWSDNSTRSAQE
jgi:hypothetical protein